MTATLQPNLDLLDTFWKWPLLVLFPLLLAAGGMEPSAPSLALPDEKSYRTPLSDSLSESSTWRAPAEPEATWRQPSRTPSLDWRTSPPSPSESSRSRKTIDLFPRYQSGNPNDFDHINREEKPQIKVFEFG